MNTRTTTRSGVARHGADPRRELPLAAYVEALDTAEAFRRHLDGIFRDLDVLLTPSAAEALEGLARPATPVN